MGLGYPLSPATMPPSPRFWRRRPSHAAPVCRSSRLGTRRRGRCTGVGFDGLAFLGACAGLRPATPDGLPIVGPSAIERVTLATGHGREGIMHAPPTAEAVAAALSTGRWPRELGAFAPQRLA